VAKAEMDFPVFVGAGTGRRSLHQLGTITVDVEIGRDGRISTPSESDFLRAFKNVKGR
jgi:hypothetical protein